MASYHTKHAWACPLYGRPYGELADCTCDAPGSKTAREAAGKGRSRKVKVHRGDDPAVEVVTAPPAVPTASPPDEVDMRMLVVEAEMAARNAEILQAPNQTIQVTDPLPEGAAALAAAIAEQGSAILARGAGVRGIAAMQAAVESGIPMAYLDIGAIGADDLEDEWTDDLAIRADEHPMIFDRRRLDRLGDLISTASGRLVSVTRVQPTIPPTSYQDVKNYGVLVAQVCPACREPHQVKVTEGDKEEIALVADIGREARRSRLTHRCVDIVHQLELLTNDELARLAHDLERDGTALIERHLACERELNTRIAAGKGAP